VCYDANEARKLLLTAGQPLWKFRLVLPQTGVRSIGYLGLVPLGQRCWFDERSWNLRAPEGRCCACFSVPPPGGLWMAMAPRPAVNLPEVLRVFNRCLAKGRVNLMRGWLHWVFYLTKKPVMKVRLFATHPGFKPGFPSFLPLIDISGDWTKKKMRTKLSLLDIQSI